MSDSARFGALLRPFVFAAGITSSAFAPGLAHGAIQGNATVAFRFIPAPRAQLALWLESADGTYLAAVRLTLSVSYYGIGNRPGASQMNSGFRWPYGRREGVLPVWAHRRVTAPGARSFRRVIFQKRLSEGRASQTSRDDSADPYFCLSFDEKTTQKSALDATTCASKFTSDKGRYMLPFEAGVYAEPVDEGGMGALRPMSEDALYPPRRDVAGCAGSTCRDSVDVRSFASDARAVMPDIDAITTATPEGNVAQEVLFRLPADWPGGELVAWLEINVKGDHNQTFSPTAHPTPNLPLAEWDDWARTYGYPYRGQPSVVYRVPFSSEAGTTASVAEPAGVGSLSGYGDDGGTLFPLDATITNDPVGAPGSGADRLARMPDGSRLSLAVRHCSPGTSPGAVTDLKASPVSASQHSHEWGTLTFIPPQGGNTVNHYEARYGREPIVDEDTFMRSLPAAKADLDSKALVLPIVPDDRGRITADFGSMLPLTGYHVAVRAVDACDQPGPIATAALTTTKINFAQLPPVRPWRGECFIATAAFGSSLAPAVEAIRHVRDDVRRRSGLFAAVDDLYHQAVPPAADALTQSETARAVFRELLSPLARASSLARRP